MSKMEVQPIPNDLNLASGKHANLVDQSVRKLLGQLSLFERVPGKLPKSFIGRLYRNIFS